MRIQPNLLFRESFVVFIKTLWPIPTWRESINNSQQFYLKNKTWDHNFYCICRKKDKQFNIHQLSWKLCTKLRIITNWTSKRLMTNSLLWENQWSFQTYFQLLLRLHHMYAVRSWWKRLLKRNSIFKENFLKNYKKLIVK